MFRSVHELLPLIGLSFLIAFSSMVFAEAKHPAEEKGIKSTNGDVQAKIEFVNASKKTIKVYWIDYEGNRQLYQELKDRESYEQETYLTHPWVITDEDENAWYVFFPDSEPRTVEIFDPEKKKDE